MDLTKPRTPDEDEEDNAINAFDSEGDDYTKRHERRNSSGNAPSFKDQSRRLHRSSSNIIRCANIILLIPTLFMLKT